MYRDKVVSHTLKALRQKPTKPEKRLIEITNKYNLPFRYVGNGGIVIDGLNPDFIDTLGLNLLIEVFGDYWHNRENIPSYQKEVPRSIIFGKAGYKLLVIWEHELYQESEERISNRIQTFVEED